MLYIACTFVKRDCIALTNRFDSERYQKSPASFEALARQSAMLSQSDSALFDSDHPSLAGKVLDGITFKELTRDQLDQVRTKCGLQKCEQVDK